MSQHDLEAKSCPGHIFVWSRILKIFHTNDHHIETTCREHHDLGLYIEGHGHSITPCSKIVSDPLLCYLKSDFTTFSQKWSPYWDDVSRTTFGLIPWRSWSKHDLAAKFCLAHYFVIWSQILQLFHKNDHHIEVPCRHNIWVSTMKVMVTEWHCSKIVSGPLLCYLKLDFTTISQKWSPNWGAVPAQHLGFYLEGNGQSMSLQQNRVWPITLLSEVRFYNYFTEMITILGWHVASNIWDATLKVKVTVWLCIKNDRLTEMITILRWGVTTLPSVWILW